MVVTNAVALCNYSRKMVPLVSCSQCCSVLCDIGLAFEATSGSAACYCRLVTCFRASIDCKHDMDTLLWLYVATQKENQLQSLVDLL